LELEHELPFGNLQSPGTCSDWKIPKVRVTDMLYFNEFKKESTLSASGDQEYAF
jgi:hypothetical protein